jgi:hypothetical protein
VGRSDNASSCEKTRLRVKEVLDGATEVLKRCENKFDLNDSKPNSAGIVRLTKSEKVTLL